MKLNNKVYSSNPYTEENIYIKKSIYDVLSSVSSTEL
jgi:hypothetical protein